jgi:hypothetical protein
MRTRVLLVLGLLAMVACSNTSSGPAYPSSPVTAPPATAAAGPRSIPEVLDFTAPQLGGGILSGADYSGKDVAIWFWAPW